MKQEKSDACFGRCVSGGEGKSCFNNSFKTKSDKAKCCLFTTILTSLLIAVILPSVIYQMADDGINEEVYSFFYVIL